MIRRVMTCAVEEYEQIQRVTHSQIEEMRSPWCEVIELTRIERDCGCGLTELGWFYITRPLYGCNIGERIPSTDWDGCSCGRGRQMSVGRYPMIVAA
jgi:hypothetical protein